MSNVINFPTLKTQHCKEIRNVARTTKSVVATLMRDEMLALKMPVMQDKQLQEKIREISTMYHNVLTEYFQNDSNF
jgi:hypothetical protein